MADSTILRSVDRAAFSGALVHRLRGAGVGVRLTAAETFATALSACAPTSVHRLYWVSRVSLVRDSADLAIFDEVFDLVFRQAGLRLDHRSHPEPRHPSTSDDESFLSVDADSDESAEGTGLPWATLPNIVDNADAAADDAQAMPERLPSEIEALADVPFDQLSTPDLDLLGTWLQRALVGWPTRPSRRMQTHHRGGPVAFRPTMARARRTGWEPIGLVRATQRRRRRRLVIIADVSQSMRAYTAVYLHLMRAAAVTVDAEAFAFATSLTRVTPALKHKEPREAIDQACDIVVDRFGGTRIASNLNALLHSHHAASVRGAIVIVASDGWDSDPPEQLGAVTARLARMAHHLIWLNPRYASPGFEPLAGAMAAALPHCAAILPAHNLRALDDVVTTIIAGPSLGRAGTGIRR